MTACIIFIIFPDWEQHAYQVGENTDTWVGC